MSSTENIVGVVGVGRLGVCLAACLASKGYKVIGVEKNVDIVDALNEHRYSSNEPGLVELLSTIPSESMHISTDLKQVLDANVIFVVVATPSLPDGRYDHSQLDSVIDQLASVIADETNPRNRHIVVSCTTMPEYCGVLHKRMLAYNCDVSYNPEFIAQGEIVHGIMNPDIVLVGEANAEAGDLIESIYTNLCDNCPRICRMSSTEAEIAKISLNCFITTKIAFANMIGDSVKAAGYEPYKVLSAIGSDSRVGHKSLMWGFGFGGPCFPRDNRALGMYLKDIGMYNQICEATDDANKAHLSQQIKDYSKNNVTDNGQQQPIVFEHVTYKPISELIDESQQLAYAVSLAKLGYAVTIRERPNVVAQVKKLHGALFTYETR